MSKRTVSAVPSSFPLLKDGHIVNFDDSTSPLNDLQVKAIRKELLCYACKKTHWAGNSITGYLWDQTPSTNQFHPEIWLVWAVMECGALANTEAVGSFVGRYHNAEVNAREACDNHNRLVRQRADALQTFLGQPSQKLTSDQIVERLKLAKAEGCP